jgi:hypothetical protein
VASTHDLDPQSVGAAPLYVYGVTPVSAARRLTGAGIGGADVEPTVHRDLAALTSTATDVPVRARRRDLLRHTEVLQTALNHGTVLPLRFGTVFASRQSVVDDLLAPRHDELMDLLAALAGHVELSVRVFYREEEILTELVRAEPRIRRLRELSRVGPPEQTHGTRVELGEMVAAALAERRRGDADDIVHRLVPVARDVVVEEQLADLEVVRASFLVERAKLDEFDARVDDVATRRRSTMLFKYAGPLPPHSFVQLAAAGRG